MAQFTAAVEERACRSSLAATHLFMIVICLRLGVGAVAGNRRQQGAANTFKITKTLRGHVIPYRTLARSIRLLKTTALLRTAVLGHARGLC
jgi:hypothetical protein